MTRMALLGLSVRRPRGISDEEARLAAILPPVGHRVADAPRLEGALAPLRTARFAARFALRFNRMRKLALGSSELRFEMRCLLRTLGIEVRVSGLGNLRDGNQVLMWNQASHLDHLILAAAIPLPFRSTYNVEVGRVPVYGAWLRDQGHYFLNRFDETQWRQAVSEAAQWVRDGNTVLVSPEGTRSWDGRLLPMKRGAFMLAAEARAPIVPVVVHGAHKALPRGRFAVQGGLIEVEFRAPIHSDGYDDATRHLLKAKVATAFREALIAGRPSVRSLAHDRSPEYL